MVFRDGAGSLPLPALRSVANALVETVDAVPVSPAHRATIGQPDLRVRVDNTGVSNSDVEIEVSTSSSFASLAWSTTLTNVADGEYAMIATGLVDGTWYYWRARAADTGTTGWSDWSETTLSGGLQWTNLSGPGTPANGTSADTAFTDVGINFGGAPPQWLRRTYTDPVYVSKYTLGASQQGALGNAPTAWTLQWSDDGSAWTTADTQSGIVWSNFTPVEFTVPGTPGEHRWWRLNFTANALGGSNWLTLENVAFTVSSYSPSVGPFEFRVLSGMADAHEYVHLNAGAVGVSAPTADEYVHLNIGFLDTPEDTADEYVHLNIGFEQPFSARAGEYIYLGDISTNTPTPHLWFLRPDSGRPLDGVDVVGQGVGDLQTIYDGEVQIRPLGGDDDDWVSVSIVSWQTFPATPDAYTDDRRLDPIIPVIDMEHTVIGILIPADAIPPGYQVRIRTDGP